MNTAIKEIPSRKVISHRRIISDYDQEGILWQYVREQTENKNISFASPPYNSAIMHTKMDNEIGVDVEIQRSVNKLYTSFKDIVFKETPAIKVASFTYQGPYTQLESIIPSIVKWMRENEYTLHGNLFHIYHTVPETIDLPDDLITEVCVPIKEK